MCSVNLAAAFFAIVGVSLGALIPIERNFESVAIEDRLKVEYDDLEPENDPILFPGSVGAATEGPLQLTQRLGGLRAKRGQFPWQALLVLDSEYMCGGSLIAPQWVLTAAHCVYEVTNVTVVLGIINKENYTSVDGMKMMNTQEKIVHEKFEDFSLNNDIALLKLPFSVDVTGQHYSTIRLPKKSDLMKSFKGKSGVVSGWGKMGDTKPPSETLNYVRRRIIDNRVCLKVYNKLIVTPSVLCIRNGDKKGTCNGDSGGPFVYQESDKKYTQIGLVSFGSIHSCAKFPGGYTRIPSYLDWIAQKTGLELRI